VRHAVALPTGGECGDIAYLVDLAVLAEKSGWDGVFLEDYLWYQGDPAIPTCDTWVALAALAVRTGSVTLGIEVVALPRRRPWKVAREAAGIDRLSGGRLVVGFGIGDQGEPGFTHTGEPLDDRMRAELFDEGLDIVAGLWGGEPFSYEGKHYRLREVTFLPRLVAQPRIPIWIGGGYPNPRAIERSLRWDGTCMYHRDDRALAPAEVRELRERAGDREWTIAVGGWKRRDDWDEEREQIRGVSEAGADWWVEWVEPADRATMTAAVERGPLRV
jgi:alkanesulfonate monooxygenase SsuD/methylene tetrahydromethanopterin reductase-like flavin-dependent oxidoreductase (luciferase family)